MRDRFLVVELSKPHGATCMKPCDKETRLRIRHAEVAVFSRMPQDRCYQLRVPDHESQIMITSQVQIMMIWECSLTAVLLSRQWGHDRLEPQ